MVQAVGGGGGPHDGQPPEETAWFWEWVGVGGSIGLRNSVKENALRPITAALVRDLSAILYRSEEAWTLTHNKINGIDRLLLVIDDYEILQESLGEFLVRHLLPALRAASFQSTVIILWRDQLEATHTAFDRYLRANILKRITLDPLSRAEMDELVESFGVRSPDEKERAWRDTQGYPFFVQLWIEEAESGGLTRSCSGSSMTGPRAGWATARSGGFNTRCSSPMSTAARFGPCSGARRGRGGVRWFEGDASVRDTAGSSFRVRSYCAARLVDYLRASDPDRCEELERRSRSV